MDLKLKLIAVQDRYFVNNVNSLIVKFFIKNIGFDETTILLKDKRVNNVEGFIEDSSGKKIEGELYSRVSKNKNIELNSIEKLLKPDESFEIGTWIINLDKNFAQGLGYRWKDMKEYRGKEIKIIASYEAQEIEVAVKIPG